MKTVSIYPALASSRSPKAQKALTFSFPLFAQVQKLQAHTHTYVEPRELMYPILESAQGERQTGLSGEKYSPMLQQFQLFFFSFSFHLQKQQ